MTTSTPSRYPVQRDAKPHEAANDLPLRVLTSEDHARWGPIVRRTAMRMARRAPDGFEVDALCRRGFVGLLEGLRHADSMAEGAPADTYVEYRIRAAMIELIRSASQAVYVARRASRDLARALRRLAEEGSPHAGEEAIAAAVGLSASAYEDLLTSIADAGFARIDVIDLEAESEVEPPFVCRKTLAQCIDELPTKEKNLLALLFGEDLSIDETAAVLGSSERRVTCLLTQTVHRLRAALGRE